MVMLTFGKDRKKWQIQRVHGLVLFFLHDAGNSKGSKEADIRGRQV